MSLLFVAQTDSTQPVPPKKAKKDAKPWLTKGPRRTEASQVSGARASLWSSVSHFKSKKARNVNTTRDVTLRQK
ncbi:hypothetical protein FPOA_11388 [Fusarium poae]|uniref:Uncharacterized protein n=1 Tax=Fusarium poae TaxID=36050 RepID=A0A1B8AGN9_FUSPO|nr:hypothetical protein FPOA_11388 [Fusarium poae]